MRSCLPFLVFLSASAIALEPGEQSEKHWVDARWSQTDIGPFLASNLDLPNGTLAKALSIKLGEHAEAAVCYDTALGNVRAGWSGPFLRFEAARYGLTNKPKIAGDVRFLTPAKEAWSSPANYRGMVTRGLRVILQWRIDGVDVHESPWLETLEGVTAFTRDFEFGTSAKIQHLHMLETIGRERIEETIDGVAIVHRPDGENTTALAVTGADGVRFSPPANNATSIDFPTGEGIRRAKVFIWSGPKAQLSAFAGLVKAHPPVEALAALGQPATPRWLPLTTRGEIATGAQPWVIDTLTAPYDNPWKALLFFSGIDFLPNGDAAACTIHGDVWLVRGVDEKLAQLTWHRFATGLFQPLGLRVVGGKIHVLGRDRITRLHDRDDDGEADEYENFSDLIKTSANGHDYVTSLETDTAGRFYYVDPKGVHRISADGSHRETIATGWRNPNGMSVGPDGTITVAPQEGDWTPASHIAEVRPGGYYGFGGPRITPERPLGYDLPLCWMPKSVDNSSGSQVWVTSERWGPLRGHLLNLSYGRCTMQLVLRDLVEGQPQGGVVPLPGRFLSGAMRGTFSPHDGQFYVAGSQGWQSAATRDGSLQRVRFTGRKAYLPSALHAHANGLRIEFTEPLDRATAEDPGSYNAEQWNYQYASRYGSKEFSLAKPGTTGRDPVTIQSARLLPDGRSVFLEIPGIAPVMQMHVEWNINAADSAPVRGEVFHTIHKLRPAL